MFFETVYFLTVVWAFGVDFFPLDFFLTAGLAAGFSATFLAVCSDLTSALLTTLLLIASTENKPNANTKLNIRTNFFITENFYIVYGSNVKAQI